MSTLKKTNKAILMHELEKHAEQNEEVLSNSCTLTDGMALVRKIGNAGLTYEEFALTLLNAVMSSGCSSSREDVVFDKCCEISIKNAERAHRKSGNLEFKKTVGSPLKKQWNSCLSLAKKKIELVKFIAAEWKKNALLFSNILIHVACEVECFFFFEDNCSTADHLFSTGEDAGTHFLLRS